MCPGGGAANRRFPCLWPAGAACTSTTTHRDSATSATSATSASSATSATSATSICTGSSPGGGAWCIAANSCSCSSNTRTAGRVVSHCGCCGNWRLGWGKAGPFDASHGCVGIGIGCIELMMFSYCQILACLSCSLHWTYLTIQIWGTTRYPVWAHAHTIRKHALGRLWRPLSLHKLGHLRLSWNHACPSFTSPRHELGFVDGLGLRTLWINQALKSPSFLNLGCFGGTQSFSMLSQQSQRPKSYFSHLFSRLEAPMSRVSSHARAFGHSLSGISAQTWNKLDD